MERVLARTVGAALVLALGCWSPVSGVEKTVRVHGGERIFRWEFDPKNPDEFIDSINKKNWSDGTKRVFFNHRHCRFIDDETNNYSYGHIGCNADMEENSVLGRRVCANVDVSYSPYKGPFDHDGGGIYNPHRVSGQKDRYDFLIAGAEEQCSPWK